MIAMLFPYELSSFLSPLSENLPTIVVLFPLCLITLFRKKLSCNHSFHSDHAVTNVRGVPAESPDIGSFVTMALPEVYYWIYCLSFLKETAEKAAGKAGSGLQTLVGIQKTPALRPQPAESLPHDLPSLLPFDVFSLLASYLPAASVVSAGSTSRTLYRRILSSEREPTALWTSLVRRDYAGAVLDWEVGRAAVAASLALPRPAAGPGPVHALFARVAARPCRSCAGLDQRPVHFYCALREGLVPYLLAGKNTLEQCLVGIHGDIYDMTSFVEEHPGSPETVLVFAGGDCSKMFEAVGHSNLARGIASHLLLELGTPRPPGPPTPSRRPIDNMHFVRRWMKRESMRQQRLAEARVVSEDMIGEVRVFFDPVRWRWRAWYSQGLNFLPVFVDY
mmetsp:Transcript_5986/g.12534  ORF Transcript_5986/g.12534 Transcript_5986/m.12534 type:complete len:392 (-) Transcript_5986:152-1327(-)